MLIWINLEAGYGDGRLGEGWEGIADQRNIAGQDMPGTQEWYESRRRRK